MGFVEVCFGVLAGFVQLGAAAVAVCLGGVGPGGEGREDRVTESAADQGRQVGGFVGLEGVAVVDPYPAEGEAALPAESYPPPAAEETFLEPRFRIDQPVSAAATTITGQAPPNLTLAVLDVTYNGVPLGMGQSDANGVFSIPVSGLIAGNRIGLAIGALPDGMDLVQTAETYFPHRGEGFQNLPNVGVFYDSTLVQP